MPVRHWGEQSQPAAGPAIAACHIGGRPTFVDKNQVVGIAQIGRPAAISGEDGDETGIIVVGKDHQGHGYVLADASGKHQQVAWPKTAVAAYRAHHADRIVAERNNGGAMAEATIRMVAAMWRSQRFGQAGYGLY
jgi:phage terminase large subunit-like protein